MEKMEEKAEEKRQEKMYEKVEEKAEVSLEGKTRETRRCQYDMKESKSGRHIVEQ